MQIALLLFMNSPRKAFGSLVVGFLCVFAACGQGVPAVKEEKLPSVAGEALTSVASVSALKLVNKGDGFPGPGSQDEKDVCNRRAKTYRLKVESAVASLEIDSCNGQALSTEKRVLSAAGFESVSAVVKKLKVVADGSCGADKETLELELSNGFETRSYGDSFYGCTIKDKPLVESGFLSELQSVLASAK